MKPKVISITDSSAMLGLGKTKIYELLNAGALMSVKIGRRRLVLRSSVIELIEQSITEGGD